MIADLPDETLVIMAKDGEGNSFSPLAGSEDGLYEAHCTWDGSFYGIEVIGDDDYDQPDPEQNPVTAICLWPTN